jgi:MFS family permease
VLGYSALQFGLGSVVMPIGSAVGSAAAQAIATRRGVRPVAVAGVVAVAIGCAILSQVSIHDSYWDHIFLGLLVFGPGLGAAYVCASVAALSGVAESDAGLASGLNNASFQIGGAIGVAIVTTVAVSATGALDSAAAFTHGFRSGFAAAIAFAAVGLVVALVLLRPNRPERLAEGEVRR